MDKNEDNTGEFDMEKVNALPAFKPEEYLTSIESIVAFAEVFCESVSAEELRSALRIIAKSQEPEHRLDEALKVFLKKHTKLEEDGIDEYVYRVATLINHIAKSPIPEEDFMSNDEN